MGYEPLLEVLRGGRVESIHYGALAVADTQGRLVAWVGDPQVDPFLRSSAKPFQALPLIESGAADALGLTDRQLAVICGSHTGTPEHLEVVESVQRAAGIAEADLQCGTHLPYDGAEARRLRQAGESPRVNHNNCSGKHSGMLALAVHLAAPLPSYLEREHPVQRRILAAVSQMSGVPEDSIGLGVDGCSAPNFALPLRAAATAFARLADPTGMPAAAGEACRRVFQAMAANPKLVSGPGSFDTRLIELGGSRWIAKGGAEGYYGMALQPGAARPGSPALGVALKIADGDAARRATTPVVLAVLAGLGWEAPHDPTLRLEFGPRRSQNWRGLDVGETRVILRLQRA
jgi:L-asparaginase II